MSEYYQDAFDEGRNLSATTVGLKEPSFRQQLGQIVVQALARGRSVLLVGQPGVGKTRVVHEAANLMRQSGRATVYEFSVSQLLTGTKYLGEWESKASSIIERAVAARAVVYFSDIWNLPTGGKSSNRDVTVWDLIRPFIEQERLSLIGEVTPEQLERLTRATGFARLFEVVNVMPLTREQIHQIVAADVRRLKLDANEATTRRICDLCEQFLAASDGPGPALELVEQVRDYHAQKRDIDEPEDVSPPFVEKVFSIYSGLPLLVVSPSVTQPVAEMRAWFEQRVIGQRDAIKAVVEAIALYKAGLHDAARPIGSFLFIGPTGVGKTELARALAQYLFGSETRLLRFDLSEYKDYHAYQMLVGDPGHPERPARLIDPVRARPFQVILLDEIEKAHSNVWDLLLQLLDEGRLTPATGKTVNFRNTLVVATSNVGAKEQTRASPGFVSTGPSAESMRRTLETVFRPELLNRFQHIVQFRALHEEHVRQIARLEIGRVIGRQGLAARQVAVDVAPSVIDLIVREGYDEQYGARALRRAVQRHVALPIATLLLERPVYAGSILNLTAKENSVNVAAIETATARADRAETRPIKTGFGTITARDAIKPLLRELKNVRLALVASREMSDVASALTQEMRQDSWRDSAALTRAARQRELGRSWERRFERLLQDELELEDWLNRAATRDERQRLLAALAVHEREIFAARRELTLMPVGGWFDALIELAELGSDNAHALELFNAYAGWARSRGHTVEMVCEPLSASEPIVAAISGHYTYGYLHLEAGHHRFRDARREGVVRVRVMPWRDDATEVAFALRTALKKTGLLGGRVRSRLQVTGTDLVIQNERTLTENASFARAILGSYGVSTAVPNEIRSYEREPFLVRDYLTETTGHSGALSPQALHGLLALRVERTYAPAAR